MADVIIRGMEMPRCCALCDLEFWDEDAYGDEMNHRCCLYRKGYTAKVRETGRLPDCPLVPLPAGHGRLIDADDALKKIPIPTGGVSSLDIYNNIEYFIETRSAIVPAEGGADDEQ